MTQIKWVIESLLGYLTDVNTYTDNPSQALTFSSFEAAVNAYHKAKHNIGQHCRITTVNLPILLSWHAESLKQDASMDHS